MIYRGAFTCRASPPCLALALVVVAALTTRDVFGESLVSRLSTEGHVVDGKAVEGVAGKGTQATTFGIGPMDGVTGTIPNAVFEMTALRI
jgi:hypothetical protein